MDRFPDIEVTFCIAGGAFDLDDVTRRIGITPTRARTIDDFPIKEYGAYEWCIDVVEKNCNDVSAPFMALVKALEGKQRVINSICSEFNADVTFVIFFKVEDCASPAITLNEEVVAFAAELHAGIHFDLYYL